MFIYYIDVIVAFVVVVVVVVVGIVVADYYHYYLHSIVVVIVIAYALRQSYPNFRYPFLFAHTLRSTAGRMVRTGLTASVICSQWTWAATLLQSANVAWQYGVSGPFW